jgi:hypothetical protein
MIEKNEPEGKVAIFTPNHPLKLKDLVEKRIREAKDSELNIESVLPSLITDFNIISGRPGIIYLEGLEGVEKVAYDSLYAKGEITQYIDIEALEIYAPEFKNRYAKKRQALNKHKRVIITESEYNRNYLIKHGDELLDVRLLPFKMEGFNASLMIYDDKISYLTVGTEQQNGIIIQNAQIARLHRFIFEFNWSISSRVVNNKIINSNLIKI